MTSKGNLHILLTGNLLTGWAAAEAKLHMQDEGNCLTRLEISHMALRPNHCSSLMAVDVIIREVYLILLRHLRGLSKE